MPYNNFRDQRHKRDVSRPRHQSPSSSRDIPQRESTGAMGIFEKLALERFSKESEEFSAERVQHTRAHGVSTQWDGYETGHFKSPLATVVIRSDPSPARKQMPEPVDQHSGKTRADSVKEKRRMDVDIVRQELSSYHSNLLDAPRDRRTEYYEDTHRIAAPGSVHRVSGSPSSDSPISDRAAQPFPPRQIIRKRRPARPIFDDNDFKPAMSGSSRITDIYRPSPLVRDRPEGSYHIPPPPPPPPPPSLPPPNLYSSDSSDDIQEYRFSKSESKRRLWLKSLDHAEKKAVTVIWISELAYERDRATFWSQWQTISNFPDQKVERGIRRIAFLTCCLYGFEDELKSLCNIKRCMRYRTHKGESGLQISARHGYQGLVTFLVGEGMVDEYEAGTTALHEACEAGHLEVIQLLLDANPTENSSYINTTDINRRTPLHLATENDQSPVVALLLQQPNIDVNACDQFKTSALRAAWKYSARSLKLLLQDSRVDKNIVDIYGKKYDEA